MSGERADVALLVTFQPGFEQLAERDIRRAFPGAKVIEALEPGLWHVGHVATPFMPALREAIALRHAHAVTIDRRGPDVTSLASLALTALAPLGAALDPARSWAVQTRFVGGRGAKDPGQLCGPSVAWPRAAEVNDAVAAAVTTTAPYDRRAPDQVLSLTLAGDRLLAGVSPTTDNLSAWPGGARRFARAEGSPSRAEHKLLEALEVFELTPRGSAVDLGAAPGGWTKVLAERGLGVTAVDPAALDPLIVVMPGVTHWRTTVERFLAAWHRAAVDPDTEPRPVDLLVSDVRMDARDAARMLLDCRAIVRPDGRVLTTLKLPEHGYLAVLDQALGLLDQGFTRLGARQLFHNRSEVTVLLGLRAQRGA